MAAADVQNADTGFGAFISYAHVDARWAKWLHRALETYRLPRPVTRAQGRRRLGRVFLDRSELATSANLSDRIAEALTGSDNLVVICSPTARASRWVNEEVRRFRAMGKGDRIFCLIVDGDPARGDEGGCFPPALLEDAAGAAPIEPLAADVRAGKDRPADARLKLLAGLFDLPFDALRRREQARRQRILAIVSAVSLALLAVMTVLTVFALVSRSEAVRQRDTAEQTAAFLRSLLLRADPGTAMGQEVTVGAVVAAAERDLLGSADLGEQPEVKASLLVTLAEVDVRLRLLPDARRLIAASRALAPQDASTRVRIELADVEVRLRQGDVDGSATALRQAEEILRTEPDLPNDYRPTLVGYRAQIAQAQNRPDDAMRDWREMRRLSLAADPPDRNNALIALQGEGSAAIAAGDLARAKPLLERVIATREQMGQPDHPNVLTAVNELGAVAAKTGDMPTAERLFRRAMALREQILGPDSLDVAYTRNNLGRAVLEQRRFAEALSALDTARAATLAQTGPQDANLANLEDSAGLALGGLGRTAAARAAFARGLAVARAMGLPKEVELLTDRAELECKAGQVATGLPLVAEARAVLVRFKQPEPWRAARIDAVEAGCLLASGKAAAARPLLARSLPAVVERWGAASLFGQSARRDARRVGLPAQ